MLLYLLDLFERSALNLWFWDMPLCLSACGTSRFTVGSAMFDASMHPNDFDYFRLLSLLLAWADLIDLVIWPKSELFSYLVPLGTLMYQGLKLAP